ncbi:MAG: hypothetical protein ACE5F1_23015, partial [Planctomycetota bacterium]
DDVVAAFLAAGEADAALGRCFNLAGPQRPSAREYVGELSRLSGRKLHYHPQAPLGIQLVDIAKWAVKQMIRKPENSFPAYRDLKTRALRPTIDCSLAERLLDWKPEKDRDRFLELGLRLPLEEGR